ncbi:hypothetical protein GCM10014715_55510 [Streptomyces spiralis]|uniref:Uncharacterized protein n=1 Tax=Streptomyces spiralis TaxID=66376 RepID=A0A919DYV7_9ACTN|nr:hypothetical protein GCM10014715_55510 [Streptomyces spiralis]
MGLRLPRQSPRPSRWFHRGGYGRRERDNARLAAEPHRARAREPLSKPERFDAAFAGKASRRQRRTDEVRRKPSQAQREVEAAEQRARHREEEHDQAQAEVQRAEAALRELQERATGLAQQLHAMAELRRRMRNDLDQARRRAAQTQHAAQQARHAAKTARARAERSASRGTTAGVGERWPRNQARPHTAAARQLGRHRPRNAPRGAGAAVRGVPFVLFVGLLVLGATAGGMPCPWASGAVRSASGSSLLGTNDVEA